MADDGENFSSPPLDGISFLPVNQARSPPYAKRRRAPQSCELCRRRKVRCDFSPDNTRTCRKCLREKRECVFRGERSKRRPRLQSDVDIPPAHLEAAGRGVERNWQPGCFPTSGDEPQGDTDQGDRSAMYPWQQPLSSVIQPEEQLHLPLPLPPLPSHQVETASYNTYPPATPVSADGQDEIMSHEQTAKGQGQAGAMTAKQRLMSSRLNNTADALDLLTFAASGEKALNQNSSSREEDDTAAGATHSTTYHDARSDSDTDAVWKNFRLIRRGIVCQTEAVEYLDFFFQCLWPLKPVIPAFYRRPSSYVVLAKEEPVLLTAIITIASRYYTLCGPYGEIRSERIHWHAWRDLQRYLQSAMWGTSFTRSLGTISSMLLLIDWHTKAINNPVAFADADDNFEEQVSYPNSNSPRTPESVTHLTSKQRHGMTAVLEKLNIVSPGYRSNKMSWMLLSNAIALAQEGCCFEIGSQSSAISKQSELAIAKREWNSIICVFIYLTDEHLALRLGLEPLLPEKSRKVVQNKFSKVFASSLPNSEVWEGFFDLSEEVRQVRELLHSLKNREEAIPSYDLDFVHELEYVDRRFARWKLQHAQACHTESSGNPSLLACCLSIEYNYAIIYSFSHTGYIESGVAADTPPPALSRLKVLKDKALCANRELLSLVVDVLGPHELIRLLPVRCWLFITTAGLHLLKTTIASDFSSAHSQENIKLLRATIDEVRKGSPDDTHMAVRFSRFLEVLLDAALRPLQANSQNDSSSLSADPLMPQDLSDQANEFFFGTVLNLPTFNLEAGEAALPFTIWGNSWMQAEPY